MSPAGPRRAALAAGAVLLLLAAAAAGQERSPTGRHRPPPPPPPAPTAARPAASGGGRWFLVVGAGALRGGDLVRVETLDGLPYSWDPQLDGLPYSWDPQAGGGFRTARFKTNLEPGPAAVLGLGRRLDRHLTVRASLAWSRCDVAAEASLGQYGAVYAFDRFGVRVADLGLEARLAGGASHPYVGLGAVLVHLAPAAASELAQTRLGGRVALGWHQRLDRSMGLRLEGWAVRTGFGSGSWRPLAVAAVQPEVAIAAADGLTTLGFAVALTAVLDP